MLSKTLRRSAVLAGVSALAISTQAQAATGGAPTNVSYQDAGTSCLITSTVVINGTTDDDGNGGDAVKIEFTDTNGIRLASADAGAAVGGSVQSTRTMAVPQSTTGASPFFIAHYDVDNSGQRVGPNGGLLGRNAADLTAMAAAGGGCQTLAANLSGTTNQAPVANAGPDQTSTGGVRVVLDGTASSDPDGDPLSYGWNQVTNRNITLTSTTTARTSFIVPTNDRSGYTLTFNLVVNDTSGLSDTDRVDVVIPANAAPVANAGPAQQAQPGATVQLDASGTTDAEGDPLTYTWVQEAGIPVTLINPTSATPSFVVPSNAFTPQEIRFRMEVNDLYTGAPSSGTQQDVVRIAITSANNAPVADAGPDQTVQRGDTVNLTAAGSSDPDGDTLTYGWVQTGGAVVPLTGATTATPSFTAPNVDRRGANLTFQVTATDPSGATSTDTVVIAIPSNTAPTPDAGSDQTIQGGSTVTLDGTGSTDPEGDTITYSWGQQSGTPVTLFGANTANPTFVAPAPTATPQVLRFSLVVGDGLSNGLNAVVSVDTVEITIPATFVNTNFPPSASAGADQTVDGGDAVTLDASASTDPDNDPLTYSWVQTGGTNVTLADANSANPTFTAPPKTGAVQNLTFEVTVSDGTTSAVDTVTVAVRANNAPTADAGTDDTVAAGQRVGLGGRASTDPDGDALTASWTQISGTSVAITDANSLQAFFTAPAQTGVAQSLVFELTVTDTAGASDTARVTFTVPANAAPVADAGSDDSVRGGEVVVLDGTGSSDPEGDTLTYNWVQTGGATATLDDATLAQPRFTAPTGLTSASSLVWELTVSDGIATSTDTVIIDVDPNSAPVANAGSDLGPIDSGLQVTLDGTASSDPDGDTITYSWVQTSGQNVSLSSSTASRPSFTAPLVNGTETFEFELTVSDGVLTSTDTVRVTIQALGTVSIITNVVGDDTTVGFTSNVPGLASSVTTSAGSGTISVQDATAGNYSFSVNDLRAQGYALTALTCNDTDSTVSLANGSVALALSPSENLVCTVTLADSRTAAQRAIGEFIGGRNALLLSNQPDLQRRLDRVKGQQPGGGSAMVGQVPVPGSGNLPVNLTLGPQSKSFSTSLSMAEKALGIGGENGGIDIWFEGTIADVTFGSNAGSFLLGYAGIDYLVQDGLLIGALAQFDRFDSDANILGAGQSEGEGWMVGPYVTARLAPNFYVDGRVAFGASDNSVSPLGTYIDGFETDRLLASASAIGDVSLGNGFTIWPELSLRYIREELEGYTDSLGVAIPDATIDQGEVAFSPKLDYRSTGADGWSFAPYAQFEGLLTFGADQFSVVENGLRGRGSLGLDVASPGGFRFALSGFYDGVGESDFEATGATVTVSISF